MANYIKGKDLFKEIVKSKELDKLTPLASHAFTLLVERVSRKFSYYRETDREDCKQTAYLHLYSNWRLFDPEKSNNAFAYFTEITKRGIATGWGELTRQKGNNTGKKIPHLSIESTNDGEGIYNL